MSDCMKAERDVFVGLDYHQHVVQACVLDGDGRVLANAKLSNDWHEIVRFVEPHGRVRQCGIEACTGAADLADQLIELAGWSVQLGHPLYVAKLKGSPDKSDFCDARLLADLTRVGYLPRSWRPPVWVRELRRLVRYRQQQVDQRRATKLRISNLLREHRLRPEKSTRAWTKAWRRWLEEQARPQLPEASAWVLDRHLNRIAYLDREVSDAEQQLRSYTQDDALTRRLLKEPGVGPVTAWVIRAEVGRFERFNDGKALARFAGLSPCNASSGQRQADAGLIRAGSPLLRTTLIELAHRLGRWQPRWRAMRNNLKSRGKPGSVAAAAVANRWCRGLYYRMTQAQDGEGLEVAHAAARSTRG